MKTLLFALASLLFLASVVVYAQALAAAFRGRAPGLPALPRTFARAFAVIKAGAVLQLVLIAVFAFVAKELMNFYLPAGVYFAGFTFLCVRRAASAAPFSRSLLIGSQLPGLGFSVLLADILELGTTVYQWPIYVFLALVVLASILPFGMAVYSSFFDWDGWHAAVAAARAERERAEKERAEQEARELERARVERTRELERAREQDREAAAQPQLTRQELIEAARSRAAEEARSLIAAGKHEQALGVLSPYVAGDVKLEIASLLVEISVASGDELRTCLAADQVARKSASGESGARAPGFYLELAERADGPKAAAALCRAAAAVAAATLKPGAEGPELYRVAAACEKAGATREALALYKMFAAAGVEYLDAAQRRRALSSANPQ